jgi:hypothetical protein
MSYVARAEADKGWRIWNRNTKRSWGNYFKEYPDQLLKELNGEKRPDVLTELCRISYAKGSRDGK